MPRHARACQGIWLAIWLGIWLGICFCGQGIWQVCFAYPGVCPGMRRGMLPRGFILFMFFLHTLLSCSSFIFFLHVASYSAFILFPRPLPSYSSSYFSFTLFLHILLSSSIFLPICSSFTSTCQGISPGRPRQMPGHA